MSQLILIVAVLIVLGPVIYGVLNRDRNAGSMIERQRTAARPVPEPVHSRDPAAVLEDADVSAAIAGGRKIEAIKLVRERTGLGLAEAKELVEQAR